MVLKVAPHFTLFWSTAPKRQRGYAAMFRRPCLRGGGVFVRMPLGAVAAVVCARSCLGMAGACLNQVKTLVPSTPGGCSATVGRAGAGPCGVMWEFMFSVGGPCASPSPCARPPAPRDSIVYCTTAINTTKLPSLVPPLVLCLTTQTNPLYVRPLRVVCQSLRTLERRAPAAVLNAEKRCPPEDP